jgi:uncharacterized protein
LLAATARAAVPMPDHPDGPISDYAHALAPDAVARLKQQLLSYETGSRQIAVAIFPALDDEDLEDFSSRLAQKWKIGGKGSNDGVLMTVFMKEHRNHIEVGYGLEDKLTDLQASRILSELVRPRFKEGDFEGGLRAAIAAIDTATGGHEHAEGKLRPRSQAPSIGLALILVFILGVGGFIALLAFLAWRRGGGDMGGGFFTGGSSGWSSGGSWSSSDSSSSSSDSGWSGGGGDFGGGGASGDW